MGDDYVRTSADRVRVRARSTRGFFVACRDGALFLLYDVVGVYGGPIYEGGVWRLRCGRVRSRERNQSSMFEESLNFLVVGAWGKCFCCGTLGRGGTCSVYGSMY